MHSRSKPRHVQAEFDEHAYGTALLVLSAALFVSFM